MEGKGRKRRIKNNKEGSRVCVCVSTLLYDLFSCGSVCDSVFRTSDLIDVSSSASQECVWLCVSVCVVVCV